MGPVACFCPPSGPHRGSSFFVCRAACAAPSSSPSPLPRLGVQLSFLPHTPFRSLRYSTMQPRPLHRRPKCTHTYTQRHTYRATGSCRVRGRFYTLAGGRSRLILERAEEDAIEPPSRAPALPNLERVDKRICELYRFFSSFFFGFSFRVFVDFEEYGRWWSM